MLTLFLNKFKILTGKQKLGVLSALFIIIFGISTTTILVSNRQKPIRYQPKASQDIPDSQCSLVFDVQDEPTQIVTPTSIVPTQTPISSPTLTLTPIPTTVMSSPTPAFSCQQRCGTLIGRCGTPVSGLNCAVMVTHIGDTSDCPGTCYCSYCPSPVKTPVPLPTLSTD